MINKNKRDRQSIKVREESRDGKALSDAQMKRISSQYEQKLKIPKKKNKERTLLCSVGLTGAGKTTVVKGICEKINLVRVLTDQVRMMLISKGFNLERTHGIAVFLIGKYLKKDYGVCADADCITPEVKVKIRKIKKEVDFVPI